jgi:hypothetical protein
MKLKVRTELTDLALESKHHQIRAVFPSHGCFEMSCSCCKKLVSDLTLGELKKDECLPRQTTSLKAPGE